MLLGSPALQGERAGEELSAPAFFRPVEGSEDVPTSMQLIGGPEPGFLTRPALLQDQIHLSSSVTQPQNPKLGTTEGKESKVLCVLLPWEDFALDLTESVSPRRLSTTGFTQLLVAP